MHAREKRLFWIGLLIGVGAWIGFTILEVFRLKFGACIQSLHASEVCLVADAFFFADYLVIAVIGLVMSGSNLMGYFKCSREAGDQFKSFTNNLMSQAATAAVSHQLRGGAAA